MCLCVFYAMKDLHYVRLFLGSKIWKPIKTYSQFVFNKNAHLIYLFEGKSTSSSHLLNTDN